MEIVGDPPGVDPLGAEATARAFARALLARDAPAAAALLSSDARLITPDGTEIVGRSDIALILDQITASAPPLEIRAGRTTVCGGVALSTQSWLRGEVGAGTATTARLVLARVSGRWKILIASPWE